MLLNPLRAARVDRGLSVGDVAEAVGMSRAALVAVESGNQFLTNEQAVNIAQRLGLDISILGAYIFSARN